MPSLPRPFSPFPPLSRVRRRLLQNLSSLLLLWLAPLLPRAAAADLAVELEGALSGAVASDGQVLVQPMAGFGPDWGGDAQLFWAVPATAAQPSLRLAFTVAEEALYDLVLVHTVAPDFGNYQARVDDGPPVAVSGYAPGVARAEKALGRQRLAAGSHQLVIEVTGREAASTGRLVGLDRLELHRVAQSLGRRIAPRGPARRSGSLEAAVLDEAGELSLIDFDGGPRLRHVAGAALPGTEIPSRLWPADLDGDGRDELLRWDPSGRTLTATLFTAGGDLADEWSFDGPWQTESPEFMTGDFDGDGRSEIIARDAGAATITVVGVEKDGSMRWSQVPSLAFPRLGYRLRTSSESPDRLLVQTDEGALYLVGFTPAMDGLTARSLGGTAPGAVLSYGDFDADGLIEILSVAPETGFVEMTELESEGAATTSRRSVGKLPIGAHFNLLAGDMNDDGRAEILVHDPETGQALLAGLAVEGALWTLPFFEADATGLALRALGSGNGVLIIRDPLLALLLDKDFTGAEQTPLPGGPYVRGVFGNFDGD